MWPARGRQTANGQHTHLAAEEEEGEGGDDGGVTHEDGARHDLLVEEEERLAKVGAVEEDRGRVELDLRAGG